MEKTKKGYGEYLTEQFCINFTCNDSLTSLEQSLIIRYKKQVSSGKFLHLIDIVLKNRIVEVNEKIIKRIRGTVFETKFLSPEAVILSLGDLETKVIYSYFEDKSVIWWMLMNHKFFI